MLRVPAQNPGRRVVVSVATNCPTLARALEAADGQAMGRVIQEVAGAEAAMTARGLRRLITVRPGMQIHAEVPDEEDQSCWRQAWDDASGQELDPTMVAAARATELQYVQDKNVWTRMPRAEALRRGLKIVGTKWIDINKGDSHSPVYRSRFVAKEYNTGPGEGLFAATPPLEAVRLLISDAATAKDVDSSQGVLMVNDVARAFFEAPVRRAVCVELSLIHISEPTRPY